MMHKISEHALKLIKCITAHPAYSRMFHEDVQRVIVDMLMTGESPAYGEPAGSRTTRSNEIYFPEMLYHANLTSLGVDGSRALSVINGIMHYNNPSNWHKFWTEPETFTPELIRADMDAYLNSHLQTA